MMPDPFVRQRALPGFGPEAQDKLQAARVAVIGAGGLGSPVTMYLAAAGVGHLSLFDGQHVSITDLHRQVLFGPDDVGTPKVVAAARFLAARSPWSTIDPRQVRLGVDDAERLLVGHDVVIDATDTFGSRRIVASAAQTLGLPLVWGAVNGWNGHVTVFNDSIGLDDVFPHDPEPRFDACETSAVLGTLCGQIGTAMATETLKILTGTGSPLVGTLSVFDARTGRWRDAPLRRRGRGPGATAPARLTSVDGARRA